MWNSFHTGSYSGMIAETVTLTGHEGRSIHAYYSRPLKKESYPGIVLIPHMPGWDEWCRETCRRFTEHGYAAICPDIYQDFGSGKPAEVAAAAREAGGATDDNVMADTAGCLSFLRSQQQASGKVGVIGMCSGGRHTFLAACTVEGFDAAVDCWGGGVTDDGHAPTPARPVPPIEYADQLQIPLLGIFGNDDMSPSPEQVNELEAKLRALGKDYTFYRYDGAGHGIWYYDKPMYRQEQAMDSWNKVLDFFDRHLT